jgi:hypothetical protein
MGESVSSLISKVWLRRLDTGDKFAPEDILAKLDAIRDALGSLEITADSVNLNTDDLEAKVDAATAAIAAFHAAFDGRDLATQATLAGVKTGTDRLDITLSALRDALRGSSSRDLTTLQAAVAAVQSSIDSLASSFTAEDFATEATQSAAKSEAHADAAATKGSIDAFKAAFDARDLATGAKQDTGNTSLASIDGKVATETTLADARTRIGDLQTQVVDLRDRIGAVSATPGANTVQDRLKGIRSTLDAIATSLASIDLDFDIALSTRASETTLSSLKTRADLLATEATLSLVKTRADLLSTEATLAAFRTEMATAMAQANTSLDTLRVVGQGAEATAQRVTLAAESLAALELVGVKGTDGNTIASDSNPLPVNVSGMTIDSVYVSFPDSVVSTANSTTAPLAAGATFTGGWEEVMKYAGITVIALTDQASATNGAIVQFSDDGVTAMRSVAATIPANVGLAFAIGPEARYMRLLYTNGATPQGSFRAQTIFHYQPPVPPQLPLASTTTDISLAQMALSHMKGRATTGAWVPILVDGSGIQRVNTGLTQPTTPTDTQPVSGTVAVSNMIPAVETGLAKTADVQAVRDRLPAGLDADGGVKVHLQNPLQQGTRPTDTQPVSAVSLPLPSGAATAASQDTQTTSLQLLDDVPTAQGAAPSKGSPIMGVLDDASTVAATEDAAAYVRVTAQRALHSNLRNNAGTEVGTASAPIRTDPTGTTTQPVSVTSLPLPTGAATSTNQTSGGQKTQVVDASGNVMPAGDVAARAIKVDGSAVTQPVSASSLPLPSGASQEHTTAASPHAARLTDGTAFYKATTPSDTQPISASSLPLPAGAAQEHATAASPHAARLSDGASFYKATTPSDTQPISAASLPLPSGAAQEHTAANSPHAARLTDGSAFYKATTPSDTQPISAVSLPLPTGATTEATLSKIAPPVDYIEKVVDLGTAHAAGSELALIGSTKTIRWAKLVYHDGAASTVSAGAISGNYLYVGSTSKNKVYLPALTAPDSDVVWEGRISGDIYLVNTAQSGKSLIMRVAFE